MIVGDASALVDLLLRRRATNRIEAVLGTESAIHVPHLLDTEVLHGLRRWVLRGHLAGSRGREALEGLERLPLVRYAHAPFSGRVWGLRHALSAYDATYVALAEGLGATLLTSDARLARGAAGLVTVADVSA